MMKINKMSKIIKYAIVPVCLVLALFIGASLNEGNNILEDNVPILCQKMKK